MKTQSPFSSRGGIKRKLRKGLVCLATVGAIFLPASAFAGYTFSADGTEVTDSSTGLVWRRCLEGMSWNGTTCAGTASTGPLRNQFGRATAEADASGKSWRLPNVKELYSLINLTPGPLEPLIDPVAFPGGLAGGKYWTSTPSIGNASTIVGIRYTWYVNFGDGHVESGDRQSFFPVRLVQ
jgi:hypothetical protein